MAVLFFCISMEKQNKKLKMFNYLTTYIYLYFIIILICVVNFIIYVLISVLNKRFSHIQSLSSVYECGFLPFHESRIQIESKFFLVALSYIIFDLEICFLIPWFLIFDYMFLLNIFYFFIFYLLILIGFIYEIQNGVLDWINE